MNVADIRN